VCRNQPSNQQIPVDLGFSVALHCLGVNFIILLRFLRYHGVESEPDSDTVYLDRSSFFHPDSQPPVQRSRRLIDAKKNATYGEVMLKLIHSDPDTL
jgi:hypothetical protein